MGANVSGYDKTPTELTDQLQNEGIKIHFEDDVESIDKEAELVIYTPAIPKNHHELNYFVANNYTVRKRSEILGELTKDKFTIAVAGSHGKTTVTSMIAWILKHSGYDCTAFLGGICINFNSNFVAGNNDVFVVEADEFDRSFLQLFPNIAVITAADSDHLEIYGTQQELEKAFVEFANHTKPGGVVIAKSSLPFLNGIKEKIWTYSIKQNSVVQNNISKPLPTDLCADKFSIDASGSYADLNNKLHLHLIYPGIHNIENAIAATSVCLQLNIQQEKIAAALTQFKGIHRRFEIVFDNGKIIFIDDYAHHPQEIKMFLMSVKEIYKSKKITAIFQPHLFTRTRDLALDFAESLDLADEIFLLPIYPAREQPFKGVSSDLIFNQIKNRNKLLLNKKEVLFKIKEYDFEVLCTIGAGDIDQMVKPIENILSQK
jgi:UDP-N-acetylmuramate--alanine ligase